VKRPPREERLFCSLREAATFLRLSDEAAKKRVQRGTMPGVARSVDGSLWRPDGRGPVLVEAAALRSQLRPEDLERFDAWRNARRSLAAVRRELERERQRV